MELLLNPLRIQARRDPAKNALVHVVLDPHSKARLEAARSRYTEIGGRVPAASAVIRRGLELLEAELDQADTVEREAAAVAALVRHIG
jgi:hypothetical protein